ncbi:hypothetical protein L5515_006867 [Caenorhabditis briggsae]|uniref:Nuclear receptor domain-containing protein n=1 Tax=Caenorhabditis briggsae TaxID=6238 RepID=A0AAE9JIN5_CAEBR|nr:hypothetical protein L5515_006867 [Caenorhabditis briggsae]
MPALQKCRICGSAKHIGSRYRADSTCAACASFFRRIVNLKKSENLKCRTLSEKCLEEQFLDPDKNSKKLCKFCRYQKCLKIGMEPEWSEESTMVLVTKNTGPEINTFRKLDDEMSKNLKNLRNAERIIIEYTEIFLDSDNQKFEKILENVAGQNGHSIVPLEKEKIVVIFMILNNSLSDIFGEFENRKNGNRQQKIIPKADSFPPLIRNQLDSNEYSILKAILLCNPGIQNLSPSGQELLYHSQNEYSNILLHYSGPEKFANIIGVIPVLEEKRFFYNQSEISKILPMNDIIRHILSDPTFLLVFKSN